MKIYKCFQSNIVVLNDYIEHDAITANTQAVTHLAFLSMGSAWMAMGNFPWEDSTYVGGIDNVKSLMALRIYASKWHVFSV
jgi:prephenate dehydrogenase (NADP+)